MTAWVRGRVQGVGFRWFTRAEALRIGGLDGFVVNLGDGRVQVVAEGGEKECELLLEWLREGDTPGEVTGVTEIWEQAAEGAMRASQFDDPKRLPFMADHARLPQRVVESDLHAPRGPPPPVN